MKYRKFENAGIAESVFGFGTMHLPYLMAIHYWKR